MMKKQVGMVSVMAALTLLVGLLAVSYLWWGEYEQRVALSADVQQLQHQNQEQAAAYDTMVAETQALKASNNALGNQFLLLQVKSDAVVEVKEAQILEIALLEKRNQLLEEERRRLQADNAELSRQLNEGNLGQQKHATQTIVDDKPSQVGNSQVGNSQLGNRVPPSLLSDSALLPALSSEQRMHTLVSLLSDWLASNANMPIDHPPRVLIKPPTFLQKKYGSPVYALYDHDKQTIYLSSTVDTSTIRGASVVLHELVHHYQNESGAMDGYTCLRESERLAYDTQRRYLQANKARLMPELHPLYVRLLSLCGKSY